MILLTVNNVLVELDNVSRNVNQDSTYNQIKDLLKAVPLALDEISTLLHKPELKHCHNRVKLCASQISKSLPHLVNEFSKDRNKNLDIILHLTEKLRCCLSEITHIKPEIEDPKNESSVADFVHSMDSAIGLLNDNKYTGDSYKILLEDLLCHALTIAKLSCSHDYNEITSGSRNVLSAMSSLLHENYDAFVYKNYLLSTLEALERKVNISVLRLVLQCFSEPFSSIKNLVKKCSDSQFSTDRKQSDLEEVISRFDLHCDRIHLIGNFAIACSENKRTILAVESCLASLEFSEKYLVPALSSFYMDSTSWEKRTFLKYLIESWQSEVTSLNTLLDDIIDTPAFVQVAHEDLCEYIDEIKKTLSSKHDTLEHVNVFIKRGKRIVTHINRSTEEDIKNNSYVIDVVKELSSGLNDLRYLSTSGQFKTTDEIFLITKFEQIVPYLDTLSHHLHQLIPNSSSLLKLSSVESFRGSIKDLSLDVSVTTSQGSSLVNGMDWLKLKFLNEEDNADDSFLVPYMNKASEKSVLRSFYSKTPTRSFKIFQRDSSSVSDVLEKLEVDNSIKAEGILHNVPDVSNGENYKTISNSFNCRTISTSIGDTPTVLMPDISKISSSERLNDINIVEDKINRLKFNNRS